MPRDGAIIFSDLISKLDVLRVACAKCERTGRYRLDRLIERRGRDAKIVDWLEEITADCPNKSVRNWNVSGFAEGAVVRGAEHGFLTPIT